MIYTPDMSPLKVMSTSQVDARQVDARTSSPTNHGSSLARGARARGSKPIWVPSQVSPDLCVVFQSCVNDGPAH